jgi:hypothetical protein
LHSAWTPTTSTVMNTRLIQRTGELQVARKAFAEKCQAIAIQCLPEGYTVENRKSLSGHCDMKTKVIKAPQPVTRKSLYVFLHECAHAVLNHMGKLPRHVEEMQAEKWAHERMREHGIPVPTSMSERVKRYVERKIHGALRRGARKS